MSRAFHIRPSNDGQTLATALRKILGDSTPWSEVKRLIAKRHVTLNGNLCLDEARKVKTGDVLHLFDHSRAPLPTDADIVIRYIDADLVVIEKPAGLNTLRHREETDLPQQRKDKAPTLDELLQKRVNEHFRSLSPARPPHASRHTPPPPTRNPPPKNSPPPVHPLFRHKSGSPRPSHPTPSSPSAATAPKPAPTLHSGPPPLLRPVHRLDRETSGLMLFAFTPAAEQALERDFARHAVERKYLAIVAGSLTQPRTIESWILRDRGDGKRGSAPNGKSAESQGAQRALTHVTPLQPLPAHTLVECQLETGRTHQIRIHLSELGHPLAGDKTYSAPPSPPIPPATPLPPTPISPPPRHALHSHHLRFTHPTTGESLEFSSPWPPDIASWLKKLRAAGE